MIMKLVGCVLLPIDSEVIERRHRYPHLLSLAKDVKLGKYGIEPRAIGWQSITLLLCHATTTMFMKTQISIIISRYH